jgi:hypothetical protein
MIRYEKICKEAYLTLLQNSESTYNASEIGPFPPWNQDGPPISVPYPDLIAGFQCSDLGGYFLERHFSLPHFLFEEVLGNLHK